MRNAALVLGVIGGFLAMIVGFFGWGYTELVAMNRDIGQAFGEVAHVETVRIASFAAPLLGIAGGAMARSRALAGGILMLASAGLMYHAFGFGVFTMFPIGMCCLGGILAVAAGRPDEERAHF